MSHVLASSNTFQIISSSDQVFSVRSLLGAEDQDVALTARKVAEAITQVDSSRKSFLVSLGFKQGVLEPSVIAELVEFVKEEFVRLK